MAGGIMQLVAYGAQDIYLTGNPMITYFKVVYRRHTNFAVESIEQTFNGLGDFGAKVSSILARNGDLISSMCIQTTLPDLKYSANGAAVDIEILRWTDDIGHHLIEEVSVEIGGQLIDRHYGDWLEIWAQLTLPASKKAGYREMIGQDPRNALGMNTGFQADLDSSSAQTAIPGREIYVPMQFWFCRNVGLALPLIALQYHEVKVTLTFRTLSEMIVAVSTDGDATGTKVIDTTRTPIGSLTNTSLWVDYIYLDTDERRRFAQVSHEYLIEQVQYTGEQTSIAGADITLNLAFNHPVKELIWVCQYEAFTTSLTRQWSNYSNISPIICTVDSSIYGGISNLGGLVSDSATTAITDSANIRVFSNQTHSRPPGAQNPVATAKLKLNGHDRFASRPGTYFNWVQCKEHHTNIPDSPGINVYSFALKPEGHQPSGTCNFSRIDIAKLVLTFNTIQTAVATAGSSVATTLVGSNLKIRVYAFSYNILRVMSGMGGLAYSE